VQDHGGRVQVFSDGAGAGSRFVVSLPSVHEAPARGSPVEPVARVSGEHRVLIVDDNRDSANALAALLELHGHTCKIAYDGATALTLARTFRAEVGVIDIGLPDMSGFEVAQALRLGAGGAGLKLVALSGYSADEFKRNAQDAGFDHYFAKPLRIEELLGLLAQ
jgi:DNA-binding response OmpR family regulator